MSMPTIVKGEYGIRLTKKAQALLPAFDLGRKKSTAPQNSASCGDPSEIRTRDTLIKSQVLYQLS